MGKVHYSAGIDYVTGALDTKHELVARLKHLHDTNGALTKNVTLKSIFRSTNAITHKLRRVAQNSLIYSILERPQSVQRPLSMPINFPTRLPMSSVPFSISTAFVLNPNSKAHPIHKPLSTNPASRNIISASITSSVR